MLFIVPLINDVTTSPGEPPRFRALARLKANRNRSMDYPARFAAIQRQYYPDLAPARLAIQPHAAFQRVRKISETMPGWTVVSADAAEGVVEAVAQTRWLKFKDDVVIEVRPEGTGSEVRMRSKSRLGRGDLGANAARIRRFLKLLGMADARP